jgi:hypothetical protein
MAALASVLLAFKQAFFPPTGSRYEKVQTLLVPRQYAGDPTNNDTPDFQGQFCEDTTNHDLYWASTTASSGWKKLNN